MRRIVIIIPTYNESGNVAPVTTALAKVFKDLQKYDPQILFVDDNSPDGTAKKIVKLNRKYSFVHLLKNREKGGLGHAYKKGMRYAIDKLHADVVFEFDADLSHDPTIIPAMLREIENGADMVMGSRYIRGGGIPPNWGIHRKFLSVVGNLFIKTIMLDFHIHDWTSGYRAIRTEVVERIIPLLHNHAFSGYSWQIGFLVKTLEAKFKVSEVAFVFKDRTEGRSKLGPEYIINNMAYLLKVRFSQILHSRALKFVLVGGLGSLIQLTALHFYRLWIENPIGIMSAYQLALVLSIETAIVSNFTWSNLWTFRDRKLKAIQIPGKFLQFNLTSGGSILIQFLIASFGERFIGLFTIFGTSVAGRGISLDTGLIYAAIGILVGMFWNFFAYTHFIWKKKK